VDLPAKSFDLARPGVAPPLVTSKSAVVSSTLRTWPTLVKDEESARDNHVFLLVTLPNIHQFKKITHTLNNKLFLIWLLTTPLYLKYVATPPCNLSLSVCFTYINVSQGSVATYARCGGIFHMHLTATLLRGLPMKSILNRLKFDRIVVMSLWSCFCWPTL